MTGEAVGVSFTVMSVAARPLAEEAEICAIRGLRPGGRAISEHDRLKAR
jgi:hypothetical protein